MENHFIFHQRNQKKEYLLMIIQKRIQANDYKKRIPRKFEQKKNTTK